MKKLLASAIICSALFSAIPSEAFQDFSYRTQVVHSFHPDVWKIVRSYPTDDQKRIIRLIDEVDLSSFSQTFPVMSPFAVARFLRITAFFCFSDESYGPLFEVVINRRPESSELFNFLFLQKIAEQELVRRHVVFDELNLVMIWDPSIFDREEN